MKFIFACLLCLLGVFSFGQITNQNSQQAFLHKDSIASTLDGYTQVFYYYKSTNEKASPLIVQLHSWSYPADSLKTIDLDLVAKDRNYNYVFPNFRGVNNHPKACCSEYVIADIDECIDWALKNMQVDKNNIYVIGYSGGGYATLSMYMRSRHKIKAFSAWASISDLVAWYGQSVQRKNKYAREIISCTGAGNSFDSARAKERSPLTWVTPVKKRKNSVLQIFAGIHDGHDNAVVPISQSIRFYNKIIFDYKENDVSKFVSPEDEKRMLDTQTFPVSDTSRKISGKTIYYQKSSKKVMLTIFEGGHDMLSKPAVEYIEEKLNKAVIATESK